MAKISRGDLNIRIDFGDDAAEQPDEVDLQDMIDDLELFQLVSDHLSSKYGPPSQVVVRGVSTGVANVTVSGL